MFVDRHISVGPVEPECEADEHICVGKKNAGSEAERVGSAE